MPETTTPSSFTPSDRAAEPAPDHVPPVRAACLRRHLVDTLSAAGYLTTSRWREAFRSVPRERFFGRFSLPSAHGLGEHDLSDPDRYDVALAAIYTDNEVRTRQGTGHDSSPAPSRLATMLEHLAARPGQRVLQLGTAGGYPAALLAEGLGDDVVTTVEPDPASAEIARSVLAAAGYHPALVTGPPTDGCPRGAPYDRLLATDGPGRVPGSWVAQLRTGGVLVAAIGSGLVRLTAREDGSADGPFLGPVGFDPLRSFSDRDDRARRDPTVIADGEGDGEVAFPVPRGIFTDPAVQFLFRLHRPGLRQLIGSTARGTEYRLEDVSCGSWARVVPHGSGRVRVTRGGGPTDLWRELGALVVAWNEHGRPRIDRYGLTVRPDGTHVLWLDERAHAVAALCGGPPSTTVRRAPR